MHQNVQLSLLCALFWKDFPVESPLLPAPLRKTVQRNIRKAYPWKFKHLSSHEGSAHGGLAPFRRAAGRTHALGQSTHDILSATELSAKYGDGACMTSSISAVLRPGGLLSRRHQKRAKSKTCSLSDLKSAPVLFSPCPGWKTCPFKVSGLKRTRLT